MENKEPDKEEKSKQLLAVIRVRGMTGIKQPIRDTMDLLRLYRKNFCVIVPNNDKCLGMIRKVKDYVTYGEIDDETQSLLIEKRGKEQKSQVKGKKQKSNNKSLKTGNKEIKKYFRLNMPKKGYGRKGIKVPFNKGGALGYRAEKINELIKRML